MASITIPNTLSNGATIKASEHNQNLSEIQNFINGRNSGATPWDALSALSSTLVPLVSDNQGGSNPILSLRDNGATAFEIGDGGTVSMLFCPAARAYKSAATQAISSSSLALVVFDVESYDVKSEFASSTYTAGVAGKYLAVCGMRSLGSGPQRAYAEIRKNNTTTIASCNADTILATGQQFLILGVCDLAATDFIDVRAHRGSANSYTIQVGEYDSFFAVHKIA